MSVRPSVRLFLMYSIIFRPIKLGKAPKDAEISEVLHSTRIHQIPEFSYSLPGIRGEPISGKINFLNFIQFYGYFWGKLSN